MVQLRARHDTAHQTDPKSGKTEPATDDEPLSSSDEDIVAHDSDLSDGFGDSPRVARLARPKLEEKLDIATTKSPISRGKGRLLKSPGTLSRKRAEKDMLGSQGEDNNGDGEIFESLRSSQGVKKRRSVYGRRSESFQRPPSSSMASQSPSSKKNGGDNHRGDSEDKENRKEGFKMPMDIDVDILIPPSAKTRSDMVFKQPPPLPPGSVSSSSLVTSSMKNDIIFDTDDDDDSSLSSAISFNDEFDFPVDAEIFGNGPSKISMSENLCPMCKEPVEETLLLRFQAQPNQRIRDQQRFCESHKKSSAEKEWHEKGYPTIDWAKFDERIRGHFDELEKILIPDSTSYYRNVLDTTLKTGQAKNFKLSLSGDTLENISCGYYGTRGAGKMLQAITGHFSRKLRRLATSDHIVNQAGVVIYSQAVLVPELAVRLVKEDMGVNDESARQILRDSIEIGEKLNYALNDSVPVMKELLSVDAES